MDMQTQTTGNDLSTDVSRYQSANLEMTADAEDAVQEAMLAAYRHINQFRGQSQMVTWLTRVVHNSALMQLRKRPRRMHLSLDEQTGGEEGAFIWEKLHDTRPNPEEECRNLELSARLQKCVALLSPSMWRTFQLRVLMGLSIFETARILGLPNGTVKAQLARARAKIARHMRAVPVQTSHRTRRLSP